MSMAVVDFFTVWAGMVMCESVQVKPYSSNKILHIKKQVVMFQF